MKRRWTEYGMVLVLFLLCLLFSALTLKKQGALTPAGAARLVEKLDEKGAKEKSIFVVGAPRTASAEFAEQISELLGENQFSTVKVAIGTPREVRQEWEATSPLPGYIVTSGDAAKWTVLSTLKKETPSLQIVEPEERWQSDFLKRSNLLAVVDRIVVIAVIAIGMTLIILTGGIDLSVGSLIALSAVISTLLMRSLGGIEGSGWVVVMGFLVATIACGLIGGVGGFLVAQFKVAPFITTLAIMMMARGFAFLLTGGFSIYQVPPALTWLGQGSLFGVPNTVILLAVLYLSAHWFMENTRYGRYIYAVGGNEEAARLSGVPVKAVLIFVYLVGGLCAGFGGCIQASQLNSGAPNLGMMFELYVIAAVVVGGTSLSGGSGRIFGTLIGAFIISVIQNGMNLLGFESYLQQVVLGGVILAAVLLDRFRQRQAAAR